MIFIYMKWNEAQQVLQIKWTCLFPEHQRHFGKEGKSNRQFTQHTFSKSLARLKWEICVVLKLYQGIFAVSSVLWGSHSTWILHSSVDNKDMTQSYLTFFSTDPIPHLALDSGFNLAGIMSVRRGRKLQLRSLRRQWKKDETCKGILAFFVFSQSWPQDLKVIAMAKI